MKGSNYVKFQLPELTISDRNVGMSITREAYSDGASLRAWFARILGKANQTTVCSQRSILAVGATNALQMVHFWSTPRNAST